MTQHFAKLENSPRLQHTKGPWTCVDEDGRLLAGTGDYLISTGAPDWRRVANVDVPIHGVPMSIKEVQANTHLIAAAPELLEALQALGAMPEGYCFCFGNNRDPLKPEGAHTGECQDARAAIDKATGGTDL